MASTLEIDSIAATSCDLAERSPDRAMQTSNQALHALCILAGDYVDHPWHPRRLTKMYEYIPHAR